MQSCKQNYDGQEFSREQECPVASGRAQSQWHISCYIMPKRNPWSTNKSPHVTWRSIIYFAFQTTTDFWTKSIQQRLQTEKIVL